MKTIFITIYDGDTEKVVLRSGVLDRLKETGHRIVLLIRGKDRLEHYRASFENKQVVVELLPPALTSVETFWYNLSWNSVPTRAVYIRRMMRFRKHRNYLRLFVETIMWVLAHVRAWREFLRMCYSVTPDSYASELFGRYRPDVLFAPNMFSPEDFRMLRAAKRRGVRTVTTAKSWDVLTSKAFTRVRAARLLVFNEFNKEEAVAIGDYPPNAVVITGFPQFDIYTKAATFLPRDEFLRALSIDPEKNIVLMGIPGDCMTPYTHEILTELDRRIEEGRFRQPIHILARLHPKYPDSSETLTFKHITLDRPGTHFGEKKEYSIDLGTNDTFPFTFTDADILRLANSIHHSVCVINTGSTLTLDAAANDKPGILIAYDGNHSLPYWDSIARIYERDHYRKVVDTGAAPLVRSHDELERAIERFLEDPDYLHEERKCLKERLLYKVDGKSAQRVAKAVLEMLP